MKKNTLLYIILIVLLIANGFFISQHLGKPDREDRRVKGPENFISKRLGFNESQLLKYKELKSTHRKTMNAIDEDIRILKDEFFSNISNESITMVEIDSVATLISEKEKQKDIGVFNHFRDLRKICNDEQKERFSAILKNAMRKRGRKGSAGQSRRGEGPPR